MPRKQRFKPSRKPKLAEGTVPLTPVSPPPPVVAAPVQTTNMPPDPPVRPVRGRDAVIDE